MGQEIVYCAKCANRLLSNDFEKGKAFRIGDQSFCSACAKDVLAALPESERRAILAGPPKDPRRASSPALPAIRSETPKSGSRFPAILPPETPRGGTRLTTDSSTKVKTTVRRMAPKSGAGLYVTIGAGVAIVLAVVIIASTNRPSVPANPPPPSAASTGAGTNTTPRPDDPVRPSVPRAVPPAEREAAAKKILKEALDFAQKQPGDLAGQLERFKKARWEADGTPLLADAEKELDQVRKKIASFLAAEAAPIDEQVRGACAKEEFGQAIEILEKARPKSPIPDWAELLDAKVKQVHADARKAYDPLREEALQARRAGAEDKVKSAADRIGRWGMPALAEDLQRALAEKPSVPPPSSPALAAYRKRWEEALAPLALRDYAGALRELERAAPPQEEKAAREEHARDVEDLRRATALLGDALYVLSKWPRGKTLKLVYLGDLGNRLELEGPAGKVDAGQVEVMAEGEPVAVPIPEIAAATLVEIFKGRPDAKPETDARAAEVFLALEGEEGTARTLGEKYEARARRLALDTGEKERTARTLFWSAEDEARSVSTRAEAVGKYHALLAEHAETAFVRRNRALIASRPEGVKEYFFFPHDLSPAGTFMLAPGAKIPSCQMSAADSPPEKGKDNYVEIAIYAAPEAALKCWVYAGACCAETFTFYAQVTDLAVPNPSNPKATIPAGPGDNASVLVKHPLMFLKRLHAMHGGPKAPERWAWFEVPLPKFPSAGVKKVRILTDQQGFAVAYALVSATKKNPPGEADTKEILKAHAVLVPAQPAAAATGTILREYWTGISGHILANLLKHPNFPNTPSGTNELTSLEGPVDFGDDYGTRIRGYLHPPQTGLYLFWITGDDQYELWLSPDENHANKKKIAWCYDAKGHREWKEDGNMKSPPIPLAAGRRYYVEVLHKEGGGGDHVSVGWKLPDGTDERPIPGTRLSPWGAVPAAVAPAPPKRGKPAFYRAINLNGPPLAIDGLPWEGKDAPNYSYSGERFENQNVALHPPPDANKARMIRASVFNRGGSGVKLAAVPKGTYQVWLYVWEDNASQMFDLSVNGKVVQQRYASGTAGHWDRLGPWTVEVADGAIEVKATAGDANFSGIEVWRVK